MFVKFVLYFFPAMAAAPAAAAAATPAASPLVAGDAGWQNQVQATSGFWFHEENTDNFTVSMRLESMQLHTKSDFQDIQIVTTAEFGRTLVLDHKTQSAARDEHIYHESLVHPAMLMHPNPKSVYIGGGGEMGTAREVLRHTSVEKCVMVDIDPVVCEIAWTHLQQWSAGVKDDPRFQLFVEDAKAHLEKHPDEKYDVIIMDIADPIEAGPGIALYTQEFYKFATQRLNPGGLLVTQSGPGSHFNVHKECFTTIHRTLRSVFDHVYPYAVDIPSFGSNWGFNIAVGTDRHSAAPDSDDICSGGSLEADVQQDVAHALTSMSIDERNAALSARFEGGVSKLKFYDAITHLGIFGLPIEVRQACVNETRIMTLAEPVFMH